MARFKRGFARNKLRLVLWGLFLTFVIAVICGTLLLFQDGLLLGNKCPPQYKSEFSVDSGRNSKSALGVDDGQPPPDHTLCLIIPFRDRFEELMEFVPYMNKFLKKQDVAHKVVVVNQVDKYRFNRASLINVGFLETRQQCDYIAMHDVDLLPVNEELKYNFPEEGPVHLAAPHLHPLYHYKTFVGGILLLQSKHFEMLNGLSNRYWGWGREDDEFFVRMKKAKLMLGRPGNLTTGYNSFKHIHDRRKRPRDQNKYFDQREKTRRLDKETGVSNVKYVVDSEHQLTIDESPVTVFNVYLECNIDSTPWCLHAEDHEWYYKRLEEKLQKHEQEHKEDGKQQDGKQQQQQQHIKEEHLQQQQIPKNDDEERLQAFPAANVQ